jgi:acetyl-CoA synthetase
MARTIYGNHERFLDTYYNPYEGCYFSGDGAMKDEKGYITVTGRMDDVINISGHRLGTAEIEDVMNSHESVSETAVIGVPHEIKGEYPIAYSILKSDIKPDSEDKIRAELVSLVRNKLAKFAAPGQIIFVPGLPKTRSGKIMRRILRKIASNELENLGDTTTLADPSVVDHIIENRAHR